jgi:hypothetical protein
MCAGAIIFAIAVPPGQGQWLNYPTPGIPRTPDGKPTLSAPTPRTADGRPDLSFVVNAAWDTQTNITDVDCARREAIYQKRSKRTDDPATNCPPEGPRCGPAGLDPLRIVQTPAMAVVRRGGTHRLIYTDGRPLQRSESDRDGIFD